MTEHLAQMMLVQILRLYQASLGASTTGWLPVGQRIQQCFQTFDELLTARVPRAQTPQGSQ